MVAGICYLDITIMGSMNLKDKRRVLKSILQRVGNRFNVSISEVGCHDIWRRSELGIATVGASKTGVEKILQDVFKYIERDDRIEIIGYDMKYL